MPKISVIMPVYNAEKYISETLECILAQTTQDFELILIDDCSTDQTMKYVSMVKDTRIKILKNDVNRGISFSRNRGLENCEGEYIALMDDDDLSPVDRFEKEMKFLDENENIDVVGGRYCIIDTNNNVLLTLNEPLKNPKYIKASLMFNDPIGNGSTMFRKSLIVNNNIQYQDNCFGMEDYLFWINCSLHGNITNLNEILLYWRNTGENETLKTKKKYQEERKKKFSDLQRYALEANGYKFLSEELDLLYRMFPEGKFLKKACKEEIQSLYEIFCKMISQADCMKADNREEVGILCRKQFARILEYSELWDKKR